MPQYASNYSTSLSYPLASDPVNVHGDLKAIVDALNNILPPLGMTSVSSPVRNDTNLILPAGTPVFISGNVSHDGKMKTTVERYNPSSPSHNPDSPILGLTQSTIDKKSDGVVVVSGVLQMSVIPFATTVGAKIYVDSNGNLVQGRPSTGPARYVAVVAVLGSQGLLIVQTKGNGTWGALKDGLS
jgi:hypothetical protein